MTLTCVIIDDEPWAAKLLETYVEKTPILQLAATYSSAVQAIGELETTAPDLIFCDIQMPELDGLQFAQMIASARTRIIFTTAFDKYAIEGWKVDALDYLLKPIAYNEFLTAVQKAVKWFMRENQPSSSNSNDGIFVKSDYKLIRVRFEDILYIEGLKDYVKIYLSGNRRSVVSLTSMRAIETALPQHFMRIHRSFIVNMDQVDIFERGQIVFGEKYIPISDTYKDEVQHYINQRLLQGRN